MILEREVLAVVMPTDVVVFVFVAEQGQVIDFRPRILREPFGQRLDLVRCGGEPACPPPCTVIPVRDSGRTL